MSRTYTVKIEYGIGWHRPRITVLDPPLRETSGPPLPHVFAQDHLCVHFPGEWQPDMLIAHTVVPWVSEWLLHYEFWRATGEWHGGGHEPSAKTDE